MNTPIALVPALFNLGTGEIIIIVLVVLLLFGGKKIPELMRGMGRGVRSFREGMNEVKEQIEKDPDAHKADTPDSSQKS